MLEEKVKLYNCPDFIKNDPVTVPHLFKEKRDIEISGLFAAVFAWGQRKTIINKSRELMKMMDDAPYQFISEHTERDLLKLNQFKHRTFNSTDLLYFVYFLNSFYKNYNSLEELFMVPKTDKNIENGLIHFHHTFFNSPYAPQRTKKHIPTPLRKTTCKRINMYLRWMVRSDNNGVDFGIWKNIDPGKLICPIDLHVDRIARRLGLVTRKQTDWLTALELTDNLKLMDPDDPAKYDFALFGLGVMEKHNF